MTAGEEFRFAGGLGGIPASRRWVVERASAGGCPEASLRTIALLTTEVVTNAVRHGPVDGEVRVFVSGGGREWRVAVTDESTELPVLHEALPQALGGRGVMLVERLASSWGVESHDGTGKTVWFRVAPPD